MGTFSLAIPSAPRETARHISRRKFHVGQLVVKNGVEYVVTARTPFGLNAYVYRLALAW
jgi:hypothetical protein